MTTVVMMMQIPGNYGDAMNSRTKLGAAIKDACKELDTLGELEQSMLNEAEDLLKQVGFKGSLFNEPPSPQEGDNNQ